MRFLPSSVIAGIRPFGGSTTSEACRCGTPRSPAAQCDGPPMPARWPAGTYASLSAFTCLDRASCRAANSLSLSVALVPSSSGRSYGVPCMSLAGHNPEMSGSPQGVRGGVYLPAACAHPSAGRSAATRSGTSVRRMAFMARPPSKLFQLGEDVLANLGDDVHEWIHHFGNVVLHRGAKHNRRLIRRQRVVALQ